jgi:hypothetical protein
MTDARETITADYGDDDDDDDDSDDNDAADDDACNLKLDHKNNQYHGE